MDIFKIFEQILSNFFVILAMCFWFWNILHNESTLHNQIKIGIIFLWLLTISKFLQIFEMS